VSEFPLEQLVKKDKRIKKSRRYNIINCRLIVKEYKAAIYGKSRI